MLGLIKKILERRTERIRLEIADADDLMSRMDGMAAYAEARNRGIKAATKRTIDGNRPRHHWYRVRAIIRKRIGYDPLGVGMTWPDP